tara:strand:+ start:63 stop:1466 length:1404 start_codon:yes stop_codon:yes gene_type:complete
MKKIAIIGAGPAGLTAAYKLASLGHQVEIFEASKSVGGMSKTLPMWGQLVDLGPHRFFSNSKIINEFWLEVVENEYTKVNRLTRIYYQNKFYHYPLRAINALKNLGIFEALLCLLSYFKVKLKVNKNIKSFEDWVISKFGYRLFSIFFKSYSEKLWGISCKSIDSDFASQRIKKLSLSEAIKSIFITKNKTKHKTLVDEFMYPNYGTGYLYEKMAKKIKKNGGNINFETPISKIELNYKNENKILLELNTGKSELFDHMISSMPLTSLIKSIKAPDEIQNYAKKLKFRNTILVYLRLDIENAFPDQWIYIHSKELKTGRITNFKNWCKKINKGQKDTIICLEYWCYETDSMWSWENEKLINLAKEEINKTKLVNYDLIKDGNVVRIPRCYPVYSIGYKENLKPIREYLSKFENLSVIGRYGAFKYNNQDHSILMGLMAAKNISQNEKNDLWEINTDYDYQESSKINS